MSATDKTSEDKSNDMEKSEKQSIDLETSCGLFSWRPSWIQRFADPRVYATLYFIIGVVQSSTFSYLSAVLSTIEKRFGLQSYETSWLYSGNEISQICFIAFLPFVGRVKKRPLYLGVSLMLSSLGLFLIAIPHFLGAARTNLQTVDYTRNSSDLCMDDREFQCHDEHVVKDYASLVVIFIGIFLVGIGISFYYSFGIPYLDDNSGKESSPFLMAVASTARSVGPTLGYILASGMLSVYVDPSSRPSDIDQDDPRWLGAWWMGFIIVGGVILFFSPLMTLFPGRLPVKNTDAGKIDKELGEDPTNAKEWLLELKNVSKRLLTNKIWALNLASTTVFLFGFIGFAGFLPKYFEYHFRQRASTSGSTGGVSNAVASAIGMLTSGWLIGKYKPKAKFLALLCALGSSCGIIGFTAITLTSCPTLHIDGPIGNLPLNAENADVFGECAANCRCQEVSYHPICSRDGQAVFFSPCHAGCKLVNATEDQSGGGRSERNLYWDCSCVRKLSEHTGRSAAKPWWVKQEDENLRPLPPASADIIDSAVDGYCPFDCRGPFIFLISCLFVFALIGSSTRIPNLLISLRSISPADKTASVTLSVSFLSIFAFLPGPIIYGKLVDGACDVWGEKCGERTNCLVYDTDKLRINMGSMSIVCMILTAVFDFLIWYYIGDLDLYDEGGNSKDRDDKAKEAKANNGFVREDSGIDSTYDGMVEIELGDVKTASNGDATAKA